MTRRRRRRRRVDAGRPPRRPPGCGRAARGVARERRASFETEYRFRAADGDVPLAPRPRACRSSTATARSSFWVGTATDIDDRKRAEEAQRFLLEAGAALARLARLPLDARRRRAARRRPRSPTGARSTSSSGDGSLRRSRSTHVDPAKALFARELRDRYPPTGDDAGRRRGRAHRRGRSSCASATDELLEAVGARRDPPRAAPGARARGRSICVPLVARGAHGRRDHARRRGAGPAVRRGATCRSPRSSRGAPAMAVDNARLYEQAEQRARAARVLETIADGVVLVDERRRRPALERGGGGDHRPPPRGRRRQRPRGRRCRGFAAETQLVPLDGSRAETRAARGRTGASSGSRSRASASTTERSTRSAT